MSTNHVTGIHGISQTAKPARDPVCKAQFEQDEAAARETYAERIYYFCSDECAELFRVHPEEYVPGAAKA